MANKIIIGDAVDALKSLPSESVNVCVTSPPYYGLRNYDTDGQIGLEETPEEYIEKLVEVFREVRRVLRPDGTLWVNIGDSYATGTKAKRKQSSNPGVGANNPKAQNSVPRVGTPKGCKTKDLIGIPWMLAFALRADGWYLRQDIIWQKPNCMPESVKDRCTKCHEYIFLLSKSPKYYFDAEAISEPIAESSAKRYLQDIASQAGSHRQPGRGGRSMKAAAPRFGGQKYGDDGRPESRTKSGNLYTPTPRRNKRDVWTVSTKGFKGAHFAVFPEKLVEPCILAGCPEGGTVLDPFVGSGTSGVVAKKTGRNFIGIDVNPHYGEMAAQRIESVGDCNG